MTTSPSGMWAVGGAGNQPLVEHLTGGRWSVVPSPAAGAYAELDAVTAVPGTRRLWAAGSRAAADGEQYAIAERYDGRRWTAVPIRSYANPGNVISGLEAVIAISSDDVWAIGTGLTTTGARPLGDHAEPAGGREPVRRDTRPRDSHGLDRRERLGRGPENETFTERIDSGRPRVVPSANPDHPCHPRQYR